MDIVNKQYQKHPNNKVSKRNIGNMADFVLKNNLFVIYSKFYKSVSGTDIGTKFASPDACISTDHTETGFLKTQGVKPWFWKRFIDDIFLYGEKVKRA